MSFSGDLHVRQWGGPRREQSRTAVNGGKNSLFSVAANRKRDLCVKLGSTPNTARASRDSQISSRPGLVDGKSGRETVGGEGHSG